MTTGRNIFDPSVKNSVRTYKIIKKIVIDPGDDYTSGSLSDYSISKKFKN